MARNEQSDAPENSQWFATTHWSVVLAAKEDSERSAQALEKLCRTYWPPLYLYIRHEGYGMEDAQDLTQEFLSQFVQKEGLNHLQDRRGKFRSFLLTFLKHFLSDQRDRAKAQKRGAGQLVLSLDACQAEEREALEPSSGLSADQVFEKRWAQAVMAEAARKLAEEYRQRAQTALFEEIKDLHPGEHGARSYAQIGETLGISEQAVKNAVHSFRRRYGELVCEEIAQTVSDPREVEEELQHLMRLFAQG